MDPNLYKVSLPNINSKVIPIEVKTHNCSQAAVDGEQNLLQKHAIPIVPISLFFIISPIHSEGDTTFTEIWSLV